MVAGLGGNASVADGGGVILRAAVILLAVGLVVGLVVIRYHLRRSLGNSQAAKLKLMQERARAADERSAS